MKALAPRLPYYQILKLNLILVIINSIDRNWSLLIQLETPYNYLVKLGGSPKDHYSTVSHDYKNIVSFTIDKIILTNRACHQSYHSNIAPRLNDNPYITSRYVKGITLLFLWNK